MKTATSQKQAESYGPGDIYKDSDTEYRWYAPGEIVRPEPDANPVPQVVTPLQAYLALDQAGMAPAFDSWANDPARTFAEKAFINRAQEWRRDDPVLAAGAAALGLTAEHLDGLFILAATL